MKKIFYLLLMLFAVNTAKAQAPCSDFNSGVGNWTMTNGYTWSSTNTLDATPAVSFTGNTNPSTAVLRNSIDYNNLGSLYLNQCLQFDYRVSNDGQNGASVTIYPRIYMTDGTNIIWFEGSAPVTESSGWSRLIAPIQLCASPTSPLPSNAYGSWNMTSGMTNTDFDNVMLNVTEVYFLSVATMGFSQPPYAQEVIDVDNVCVGNCGTAPCTDFNDPVNPAGNWFCVASTDSYTNLSPDGSTCATIQDGSGASSFQNTTDFNNLATFHLGKCLCFDYYVEDDGVFGSSIPINPRIFLSDGINTIWFEATTPITEGTVWAHVCAPIALAPVSGPLPTSPDGTWMMGTGMTNTDFNNVLLNCSLAYFFVDVAGSSAIAEEIRVDNICVKDCPQPCNANFEFNFVINSDPAALNNYIGSVSLTDYHGTSTYRVDWGDGAITILPPFGVAALQHAYAPGSYIVCVTEIQPDGTRCTQCIQICVPQRLPGGVTGPTSSARPNTNDTKNKSTNPANDEVRKKLETEESDSKINIYPNPTSESAKIEFMIPNKGNAGIQVIDVLGKAVLNIPSQVYSSGLQKVNLNTRELPSGVYTVVITIGDKILSEKLSVIK